MPEKQFVKAKPLKEGKEKQEYRPRQNNKNTRKKYEEKNISKQTTREPVKYMLSTFKFFGKSSKINKLIKQHPKFFGEEARKPGEDIVLNFNDCLWNGGKREKEFVKKLQRAISSDSSEPAWNSDNEKEITLASKTIDQNVIKKVNDNAPRNIKKVGELMRHERQFLQEEYLSKKNENLKNKENKPEQPEFAPPKEEVIECLQMGNSEWAEYEHVNSLIDKGYLMKVDNDDDDNFQMMGDEDFSVEDEKSQNSSSSSDDDDDMFTDEGPRTVKIVLKKSEHEIQREEPKEIVKINTHFFTKIAEQIGLNPETCNWVISNSNRSSKFRVSTHYMNETYHSFKLNDSHPLISLNNSPFVQYDDILSEKSIEALKNKTFRNKGGNRTKQNPHYKQKK